MRTHQMSVNNAGIIFRNMRYIENTKIKEAAI